MVSVSASVNLPLHHKVQKFSSSTGSPGWSRKKGRTTVVVWWWYVHSSNKQVVKLHHCCTCTVQLCSPGGSSVHPHVIHASLGHPSPHPKWHLDRFSHFTQLTVQHPYTLQWAALSPSEFLVPIGGSGLPSNACFLGPMRVQKPNGISIGSTILQGLQLWQINRETDRPTDRQTEHPAPSLTIEHICRYTHSTAVWPKDSVIMTIVRVICNHFLVDCFTVFWISLSFAARAPMAEACCSWDCQLSYEILQ